MKERPAGEPTRSAVERDLEYMNKVVGGVDPPSDASLTRELSRSELEKARIIDRQTQGKSLTPDSVQSPREMVRQAKLAAGNKSPDGMPQMPGASSTAASASALSIQTPLSPTSPPLQQSSVEEPATVEIPAVRPTVQDQRTSPYNVGQDHVSGRGPVPTIQRVLKAAMGKGEEFDMRVTDGEGDRPHILISQKNKKTPIIELDIDPDIKRINVYAFRGTAEQRNILLRALSISKRFLPEYNWAWQERIIGGRSTPFKTSEPHKELQNFLQGADIRKPGTTAAGPVTGSNRVVTTQQDAERDLEDILSQTREIPVMPELPPPPTPIAEPEPVVIQPTPVPEPPEVRKTTSPEEAEAEYARLVGGRTNPQSPPEAVVAPEPDEPATPDVTVAPAKQGPNRMKATGDLMGDITQNIEKWFGAAVTVQRMSLGRVIRIKNASGGNTELFIDPDAKVVAFYKLGGNKNHKDELLYMLRQFRNTYSAWDWDTSSITQKAALGALQLYGFTSNTEPAKKVTSQVEPVPVSPVVKTQSKSPMKKAPPKPVDNEPVEARMANALANEVGGRVDVIPGGYRVRVRGGGDNLDVIFKDGVAEFQELSAAGVLLHDAMAAIADANDGTVRYDFKRIDNDDAMRIAGEYGMVSQADPVKPPTPDFEPPQARGMAANPEDRDLVVRTQLVSDMKSIFAPLKLKPELKKSGGQNAVITVGELARIEINPKKASILLITSSNLEPSYVDAAIMAVETVAQGSDWTMSHTERQDQERTTTSSADAASDIQAVKAAPGAERTFEQKVERRLKDIGYQIVNMNVGKNSRVYFKAQGAKGAISFHLDPMTKTIAFTGVDLLKKQDPAPMENAIGIVAQLASDDAQMDVSELIAQAVQKGYPTEGIKAVIRQYPTYKWIQ